MAAPPLQRFLAKVQKRGPIRRHVRTQCHEWTAGCNSAGYGSFWDGRVVVLAHRWAYEHFVGPIPEGVSVLHRCDNPPCVNVRHLFLGSLLDNNEDKMRKGRQARGATSRSSLTEEEVREIRARRVAGERLKDLAEAFEVSGPTISRVCTGKRWAHLM